MSMTRHGACHGVLRGVFPVLSVPFDPAAKVDVEAFDVVLDHVLATGVSGAMLFGIAGEFYKLTDAERRLLQRHFLGRTASRAEVTGIVSITAHSTDIAVNEAQAAVSAGADALNVLPPHFAAPSSASIRTHVTRIAEAVSAPVIVQYAPLQTAGALDLATIIDLAASVPNLVAVKVESVPPGRSVSALRAAVPGLSCVVGYAGIQLMDALHRGASGVQPGCSFVEIYQRIWRLYSDGDLRSARDLHTRLLPYIGTWMQHIEFIIAAEKHILFRRGLIPTPSCRAPAWDLDTTERQMVDRFIDEFADLLNVQPESEQDSV